ncbi:MAG: 30S ribosome-binding factor RbfA [Peptoniphilaceae bacterium]|nr:30S ribosome-binding factor RbfA [Peptoniphilaceae bacterium]MDD7382996.1 30S ribosome-binding factor RbfA [Peptoniphilaceae bacterium]MDY3737747.1 30S ribosome-binding factor RbfA [Peptoniphilaceae bacterium]
MNKRRTQKISTEMQKQISKIIREDINDPRLTVKNIVSVTEVDVTNDLSYADIYVSVLGNEDNRKEVMEALNQAKGFIKNLIGERMRLRSMPEFRFKEDISIEHGIYMDKLIEETIEKDHENHKKFGDFND